MTGQGEKFTGAIPLGRVIDKADEYFSRNDYAGAEKHFLYWLEEAEEFGDDRGRFAILNELVGLYRKTAKKDEALKTIDALTSLVAAAGLTEESAAGTAYVNIGTALKSFGMAKEALPYFRKAEKIYASTLKEGDGRLGGLYNNEALALVDLGEYEEAKDRYMKALSVMDKIEGGQAESAITFLNLANLVEATDGLEGGAEKIAEYLDKARALLDDERLPRDGYYAFVCEKCAPTFGYYGYFAYEAELNNRSENIYKRT